MDMLKAEEVLRRDNIEGLTYGSMGGFYTYNEIVQKLDSMRLLYPNLITAKANAGNSYEGRAIWWVKISDNADQNESATEPPIYFDALIHAREPQSMASVFYYMYWLLENYNTNPEAAYIVNNREIFFVPCVNPDGYEYNRQSNPNGGGMWRKNRRPPPTGSCYGVDLNRNFNYGWGIGPGSSSNPCSEDYRGTSAASEPETQAVKSVVLSKNPKIGFNMHSVAGRYLNPYGYTDTSVAYEIYSEFSSEFAAGNEYTYGTVSEMLSYYSAGTARDWLHVNGCYAWTPEVAGGSFWPTQSQIFPVAAENMPGLKYLSWVGGAYARFNNYKLLSNNTNKNDTIKLQITVKNKGLSMTAKNVTVNITSPYTNISAITSAISYDSIQSRQIKTNPVSNLFRFRILPAAVYMDQIKLIVDVKQEGVTTSIDTVVVTVGNGNVLFYDDAENGKSHWTASGNQILWDTSFCDYRSEWHSFADSRYGNSNDLTQNYFTLKDTIDLINASNPRIEYFVKWATERNYDYARFQVSSNYGGTWTSIAGKYTESFGGQPSYHGIQSWVSESFNLNSYIGQKLLVRFFYYTDNGIPGDGIYFDNFRVVNYTDGPVGITSNENEIPEVYSLHQNYPNPFNPSTTIRFSIPSNGGGDVVNLNIYNSIGQLVVSLIDKKLAAGNYELVWDASAYPSGVYFYKIQIGNFTDMKKMVLIK
jgi:hypothetical protein